MLVRYFARHARDANDAEDLAQETLARFSQTPPDSLQSVEAYLRRIAGNLLRDRFRRDQSHRVDRHVPIDVVGEEWLQTEPSCERIYDDRARLTRILAAIEALPPRCREVFLLQRYEGLTYSSIARRLQISVSAVEKQMMRAMLLLDARMELE
jgi:RNA polymerase sigma factor (sigma-70 family)